MEHISRQWLRVELGIDNETKVIFGGRLGEYKYYDMDQVIAVALEKVKELIINK
ncbi:MAG: hypothetical protein K6G84_13095 [Lachnospiraceae bacterium]|nr:hypothetical protein [Lachnospiraceae bacterium]